MTCSLISGPASQVAQNGLARLEGYARDSITRTIAASDAMQDFITEIDPVDVSVELEDVGSLSNPFQIDVPPTLPTLSLNSPNLENPPQLADVSFSLTAQDPGSFTGQAPNIDPPGRPGDLDAERPTGVPEVVERSMPDVPPDTIPPLPVLDPISPPGLPQLELPSFSDVAPSDLAEDSIGVFSWTEETYTPTVRTDVVTQLQAILGGSTGIPDAIWDMIQERARKQLRNVAIQAREDATDSWASRGHFLSDGQLRKRVDKAADVEREGFGDLTREMVIRDSQIYVERLNVALAQGIALEDQLLRFQSERMNRSLEAAKTVFQIMVQVAQLKITVYNARMAAYFQKAQVFETVMKGELAKLEQTRTEIAIEGLKTQINLQRLEAYKAQIQGIVSKYDLYKTQVDAVLAQYEGDKIRVQAFAETVAAYGENVKAWAAEWDGYSAGVRAEVAKVEAFKVQADSFLSKVNAYRIGVEADRGVLDGEIAAERFKIEEFQLKLERYKEDLRAAVEELNALVKAYDTKGRIYEAEGRIEESRVESDTQRFNSLLQNANIKAQVEFRELDRQISQSSELFGLQYNALNAELQSNTQVGSSALAALNYAATISDGVSNSTQCQESYSF